MQTLAEPQGTVVSNGAISNDTQALQQRTVSVLWPYSLSEVVHGGMRVSG